MAGIKDLKELLKNLTPELVSGDWVFCTVAEDVVWSNWPVLASFREREGLTLILPASHADQHELHYEGVFKQITLNVHSDLAAVGLTAAISDALTKVNISANVVAAYYHDHVFVPVDRADEALSTLQKLGSQI